MIAGLDISTKAVHVVSLPDDTNDAQLHVVRIDATRGSAVDRIRRLRDAMPARTAWADASWRSHLPYAKRCASTGKASPLRSSYRFQLRCRCPVVR